MGSSKEGSPGAHAECQVPLAACVHQHCCHGDSLHLHLLQSKPGRRKRRCHCDPSDSRCNPWTSLCNGTKHLDARYLPGREQWHNNQLWEGEIKIKIRKKIKIKININKMI